MLPIQYSPARDAVSTLFGVIFGSIAMETAPGSFWSPLVDVRQVVHWRWNDGLMREGRLDSGEAQRWQARLRTTEMR